jgi:hypothetical protein
MGGGSELVFTYAWVAPLWLIALLAPNTSQIMRQFEPALDYPPRGIPEPVAYPASPALAWSPNARWALITGAAAASGLLSLSHVSQFLYFQF